MTCPERDEESSAEASDRMLAATLYLMSCHARTRCPRLACMVERHLALLARHPGTRAHVADLARKLANSWRAIRSHDEARQRIASGTPLH